MRQRVSWVHFLSVSFLLLLSACCFHFCFWIWFTSSFLGVSALSVLIYFFLRSGGLLDMAFSARF